MCGITGYLNFSQNLEKNVIEKMTCALAHRGPDGHGTWLDPSAGIAMGHTRLSIIDLSNQGKQPMVSASERYVLSYNGEIYNYKELGHYLKSKGVSLKSTSDTEILLEMISREGLDKTLPKLIGMFAFALWDKKEKTLTLCRDRMGIKPLYWGHQNGVFAFASELRALKKVPNWQFNICHSAVQNYFSKMYIPAPQAIYENIFKLKPGHILKIDAKGSVKTNCYWSLETVVQTRKISQNEGFIKEEISALIHDAVGKRMIADVPVGCFLSGGIDSATVAAHMQKQSKTPIHTFTIGFSDTHFDEAPQARRIANHLGTHHTESRLSTNECMKILGSMHDVYDEPFADSSQIPTYLISKVTQGHVKVALSGDGGDELFAGYNRHRAVQKLWPIMQKTPHSLRAMLSKTLEMGGFLLDNPALQSLLGFKGDGEQSLKKLSNVLSTNSLSDFYEAITSEQISLLKQDVIPNKAVKKSFDILLPFEQFQYWDMADYLPNDILTKVDRASMHVGLEVRVPLLDHRLVEAAWTLPDYLKIKNGKGKIILRELLEKDLPPSLFEGPKRGFSIPLSSWLRGDLKSWVEDIIFQTNPFVDNSKVFEIWNDHLNKKRNAASSLWALINFNLWYQNNH